MLDGLSPADAVGLLELPLGPSVEDTRDHSAVAEVLKRFRGRARGEGENLASAEMNRLIGNSHTEDVLRDLAKLVREMSPVRAPRSVIFISGGLELHQGLMAAYKELQRAAAESRVVLYTVLLEQVGYPVTRGESGRRSAPPGLVEVFPRRLMGSPPSAR